MFSLLSVYVPEGSNEEDQLSVEHQTFDSILRNQQNHRTYTPRKCCKVGMKVASKGLDCEINMNVIDERDNNIAYRSNIKNEVSAAFISRRLQYKNYLFSVEKCYPSKYTRSMFTKCCNYQKSIYAEIASCENLRIPEERIECLRLAQGKRK